MALGDVLKTSSPAPFDRPQDYPYYQDKHHSQQKQQANVNGLEAFRQGLKGLKSDGRHHATPKTATHSASSSSTTAADFSSFSPAASSSSSACSPLYSDDMRSALPSRPVVTKNESESNAARTRIRSPLPDESGGSNRSSVARSPGAFQESSLASNNANNGLRNSNSPAALSQSLSPAPASAEIAEDFASSATSSQHDADAQLDAGSSVVQGLSGQVCRYV